MNNVIDAFEDGIFPFKDEFKKKRVRCGWWNTTILGKSRQKRLDRIQNKVKMFKNKNRFVVPGGSGDRINANGSYRLIQDIENGKITHEEALKEIFKICNDIERLKGLKEINQNQIDMLNILFMTDEFFTGIHSEYKKVDNEYALFRTKIDEKESSIAIQQSDEQPDTTDIPDLESEESAAQRRNQQGKGTKILTPNQMLNRLSISLAQLKAGNNLKMKWGNYCTLCTDKKNVQTNKTTL